MAENTTRIVGTPNNYKADRGASTLMNMPIIGVVKNNIDPTHSGRIQVYLAQFQAPNPNDSANWVTVSYMSPFHGSSGNNNNPSPSAATDGYGKYVGNPQSYGFWASAPDIGSEVLCIFANGDPQQGYYIGCIPKAGVLSMTPSLGSTSAVVPNSAEAKAYGGADRLPTGEANSNNPTIDNSGSINTDPKPVQSYQAAILQQQGLLRDNDRGTISSSASRESPSRVFGMSTPGGPIYEGGYTNATIGEAAINPETPDAKLAQVGRTGGHTFTMDDGDLEGQNQLVRLRSSAGHTILMNDSAQSMFMIHANGQTWVEMGAEGTIDLYSTNSVNIRSEGDLNFHADRDINMHAAKDFTVYADNFNVEADTNMNIRTGADLTQYTVGKHTLKVDGVMALASKGEASIASSGTTYLNGTKINLNTGSASTTPEEVKLITKSNHPDTTYSTSKGWMYPSPDALLSVTSRAPTHQPYIGAGKGVDIKVKNQVDSSVPVTTKKVDEINAATPNVPKKATTPAITGTVPPVKASNPNMPNVNTAAVTAYAGQQAAINSVLPSGLPPATAIAGSTVRAAQKAKTPTAPQISTFMLGDALLGDSNTSQDPLADAIAGLQLGIQPDSKRSIGVIDGNAGMTIHQATMPGSILKPGSQPLLQARIAQGMPYQYALQGLVTGNYGAVNPLQVLRNNSVQLAAVGFAMNTVSQNLYEQGYFTGQESAAQAGGVIMAASNFGLLPQVTYINGKGYSTAGVIATGAQIAGITYDLTGKVYDMVAAGNFSGNLSDAISNGVEGLANSIGDAVQNTLNAVGSTLSNIANALEGTLRSAFKAVEASYKVLTEDVPNYLGGVVAKISANIEAASAKYDSAQREIEINQIIYDSARSAYRAEASDANAQALQTAEAALVNSRKDAVRASLSFVTGSAVQNTNNDVRQLGEQVPQPVTTANSGLNALPGGAGAIVNQVNQSGQSILSLLNYSSVAQNAINRAGLPLGLSATQFLNPAIYAGNLVQGTISAANAYVYKYAAPAFNAVNTVTALTGGSIPATYVISNTISGIVSTLQTSISAIGYGGQIKPVSQATQTFFRTTITSNTGQLMNDSRIPLPISATYVAKDEKSKDTSVADKVLAEQNESLRRVSDLKQTIADTQAGIEREAALYEKNPSDLQKYRVEKLIEDKKRYQKSLVEAEASYSSTVKGQSSPPQPQSAWSKWWSGDKSDTNKFFQWSETPQQKYERIGPAYLR
jgi:hypothetical protein